MSKDTQPLRIVNDQTGQPTSCNELSRRVCEILLRETPFGIYHITNSGQATWYELALAISKIIGGEGPRILPISSENLKSVVKRPTFSVLNNERMELAGLSKMPHWKVSLMKELPSIISFTETKD